MKVCTFIGHRDCPAEARSKLTMYIIHLLYVRKVEKFYVGHNGAFDEMVISVLEELKRDYGFEFEYKIVLATRQTKFVNHKNAMLFPYIDETWSRAVIPRRNKWMIDQSDFVVTYVTKWYSNACRFADYTRKKDKIVKNIPDL